MKLIKTFVATLVLMAGPLYISAQGVVIPAFTGYSVPAESATENDESSLFDPKSGLHNWNNSNQKISYYFFAGKPGDLNVRVKMKASVAGNKVIMNLADRHFVAIVPQSNQFQTVFLGKVNIRDTGFYQLRLSGQTKARGTIADIASIELSGAASHDLRFNSKPRRNAASVHLMYPLPDSLEAVGFYNQLTIPKGGDPLHSYFMACGFSRGYFGIQVNSDSERRVIFSVWDAGNEANDRGKVADSNRVKLRGKGEGVFAGDFGNEGTGGHSHWVYPWKAGETYSFYVTALPDSASASTVYTGYFFIPEKSAWKLIASFSAPRDGKYLHGLYSFVENFWGVNGQLYRRANYSHPFVKLSSGEWKEISRAKFSTDATGRAGDRKDMGGGVDDNQFFLWNGGFRVSYSRYGDYFEKPAGEKAPVVDLYRNADSLVQASRDHEALLSAIRSGNYDITGSVMGLYYQMVKTGQGKQVTLADTVVVRYKGSLLDGTLFDQSREEPARFPLQRLIRGWQIGLPLCRVGGTIRLLIPSALAYGIRDRAMGIPPNQPLVFEVEVLDAK